MELWTTKEVLRRAQSAPGGIECSGASRETHTLPTSGRYCSVYPRCHSPCTREVARVHGPIHGGRCGLLDDVHPSETAIAPPGVLDRGVGANRPLKPPLRASRVRSFGKCSLGRPGRPRNHRAPPLLCGTPPTSPVQASRRGWARRSASHSAGMCWHLPYSPH